MISLRVSVVWPGTVLLLLIATGAIVVDAQKSYRSDTAMACKIQYRLHCLPSDINRPSFKDPICVKHTRCTSIGCDEDYYTYPKGACGLADLCWNPNLSLIKHEICEEGDGRNGTRNNCGKEGGPILGSKYQFYRRLAEKLPCPRSGGRKVRNLQHCGRPYDCAMKHYFCYDEALEMPDPARTDIRHFCLQLCVRKPGVNGCAYHIYLTYTREACYIQDMCWEPGLSIRGTDYKKHCSSYAMAPLGGELLRGRVRYDSSRPFVFGRENR